MQRLVLALIAAILLGPCFAAQRPDWASAEYIERQFAEIRSSERRINLGGPSSAQLLTRLKSSYSDEQVRAAAGERLDPQPSARDSSVMQCIQGRVAL